MGLSAQGKVETKLRTGAPRPLTRADLSTLSLKRATADVSTPTRLRESHHNVARLVAGGLRDLVIAERTGYTVTRVTQLKASPAFQQLVSTYKAMVDGEFVDEADAYFKTAFGNMVAAERHIADHLADADEMGELIPIKTALAISRDAADRFGYGKRQTNLNVNVDFAAKLEDAIRRSGKLIDQPLQAVTSSPSRSVASEDDGSKPGARTTPLRDQVNGVYPRPVGAFIDASATGVSPSPPLAPAQGPVSLSVQDPAPSFRRRA